MTMRPLIYSVVVFVLVGNVGLSQGKPSLHFVGHVEGDIDKAKIYKHEPGRGSTSDYCVLFDSKPFDPFNQRNIHLDDNETRISFTKMYLLVTLPPETTPGSYFARLVIHKTLPVCTECDGGCYQIRGTQIDTFAVWLASTESGKRHLLDIDSFVSDWYLIDITVSAALFRGNVQYARIETGEGGWPWCQ